MRYSPSFLEEIRNRIPVSTVVGRRVSLKKAGKEWKGLSPFNAEKTPSFYVNDQKQFYHCFSSGKHGDIFTFLMETEGLSFPEAVERLANEAGIALPVSTREERETEVKRKTLYEVMELSAQYFEANLKTGVGAKAREYLERRGMGERIQKQFRIGYASPERYALRDFLASKGVPVEMMIETGMLVAAEDIKVPYDRFRERVMFPICDVRGRVIAFGGRTLSPDVPAKYLNSPDTPLFNKGHLLYNHHLARNAAHDRGTVIAVEGYVDVIALNAIGFANAVAPLGTALTENQLGLLWRMADEPILCFDGDKAGRRAAYRALDVALSTLSAGKSIRFALLPDGQDPDDVARSGGAEAFERIIAGAKPMVDMLWARETESGAYDTPERRAALEVRFREVVAGIRDETLKRFYRDEIRSRLNALNPYQQSYQKGRDNNRRYPGSNVGGYSSGGAKQGMKASPQLARSQLFIGGGSESPRESMIICAFTSHPELLQSMAEQFALLDFDAASARSIRSVLIDCVAQGEGYVTEDIIRNRLERTGLLTAFEHLKTRIHFGDKWVLDPFADKIRLEDALKQAITLHHRAHTLHKELRDAHRLLAEDESEENFARLVDLQNQILSLDGAEADIDKV
ncbi:DNA primase [Microvirga sp. W0021]|uniref:DNA primase n=1 Tax=Hohaiivirga grylli TaxID=3133970 RepID=A0ABV0BJV6_9HYPH